jgi:xanthine dehydrogenase iron-sulfur cluster and FAD-binding subunit A
MSQMGQNPNPSPAAERRLWPATDMPATLAGAVECHNRKFRGSPGTPGFLLMATQLLEETPDPEDDAIRHYLSGNLCRCAAYPEIINAVKIGKAAA